MTPANATLKLDDVITQVAKDKGIDKEVLGRVFAGFCVGK